MTGVVALVAIFARQTMIADAGLDGLHAYDDGVYYAGAAALVFGRMPYGEFLFLHPPGILLALSPFAEFGRLTSDPLGLAAARTAFWVLGAVNAALVTRLAARYGLVPAGVAGLLYALWYPARYAERTALLEPPGNTALLVALLLLTPATARVSRRADVLAGSALGLSACFKVWTVVPVAVVLLWQLSSRGWRAALRVALGAAAAAALVVAPFLPVADDMFRMVILNQLGRPVAEIALIDRLMIIAGLTSLAEQVPPVVGRLALLAVGVVTVLAAVAALRQPHGGLHVALLAATLSVLVASPSVFHHYGTFAAVPLMMVLAAAVAEALSVLRRHRAEEEARGAPRARSRVVAGTAGLAVSGLFVLSLAMLPVDTGRDFPRERLSRYVSDRPCVVSDDPTVLALLDVLSRDLRRGCPLLVDVTGLTYDAYAMSYPDGRAVPRPENERWQGRILGHLTSGSATIVAREEETGLSRASKRELAELPVLGRDGAYSVLGRRSDG
jgi:alpha-1,2-mannosyltransferase